MAYPSSTMRISVSDADRQAASGSGVLSGVGCDGNGDCWAVGAEGDANSEGFVNKGGTLIERTGQPAG
jgi:hypothetical protein